LAESANSRSNFQQLSASGKSRPAAANREWRLRVRKTAGGAHSIHLGDSRIEEDRHSAQFTGRGSKHYLGKFSWHHPLDGQALRAIAIELDVA
jgi:hypothetical protein